LEDPEGDHPTYGVYEDVIQTAIVTKHVNNVGEGLLGVFRFGRAPERSDLPVVPITISRQVANREAVGTRAVLKVDFKHVLWYCEATKLTSDNRRIVPRPSLS